MADILPSTEYNNAIIAIEYVRFIYALHVFVAIVVSALLREYKSADFFCVCRFINTAKIQAHLVSHTFFVVSLIWAKPNMCQWIHSSIQKVEENCLEEERWRQNEATAMVNGGR